MHRALLQAPIGSQEERGLPGGQKRKGRARGPAIYSTVLDHAVVSPDSKPSANTSATGGC